MADAAGMTLHGRIGHLGRPVGAHVSRRTRCARCGQLFRCGQTVRVELAADHDAAPWVHAPICPLQQPPRPPWRRWAWWLR